MASKKISIMKDFPVLYGVTKLQKVKEWKIQAVKDSDGKCYIYVSYGLMGGAMQESMKEVKSGKNIGKSNETTVEEQCIRMTEKEWKDKKEKENYSEIVPSIGSNLVQNHNPSHKDTTNAESNVNTPAVATIDPDTYRVIPMLADKYVIGDSKKRKNPLVFPCNVQPKLDGVRCLIYLKNGDVVCQSRQLKYFKQLDHIKESLASYLMKRPNDVLDGELYSHDMEFNDICGIVRKEKLSVDDLAKMKKIEYHMYDITNKSDAPVAFKDRFDKKVIDYYGSAPFVKIVETGVCNNENEIKESHLAYTEKGYEGIILRNRDGIYQHNRSRDLLKYKTFEEAEYKIVGYSEGEGHDEGTVIWKCVTEKGQEFSVRPTGTVEERKKFLQSADKYMGKMLTVKYQELSPIGIPRFPVGKCVRDYE